MSLPQNCVLATVLISNFPTYMGSYSTISCTNLSAFYCPFTQLFFLGGPTPQSMGESLPNQWSSLCPLQWKHGVWTNPWTTGKSSTQFLKKFFSFSSIFIYLIFFCLTSNLKASQNMVGKKNISISTNKEKKQNMRLKDSFIFFWPKISELPL